jgi:hypothetical protein
MRNLASNVINGATTQFGREFGRAAANRILKGSNYYGVKNVGNSTNDNVISVEWDGKQPLQDEQKPLIHQFSILGFWSMFLGFIFSAFLFPIYLILWISAAIKLVKQKKLYQYIISNNVSGSTVWFNKKIVDKRFKEGYRIERILGTSNEVTRELLNGEKEAYEKLLRRTKRQLIFSYIMIGLCATTLLSLSLIIIL